MLERMRPRKSKSRSSVSGGTRKALIIEAGQRFATEGEHEKAYLKFLELEEMTRDSDAEDNRFALRKCGEALIALNDYPKALEFLESYYKNSIGNSVEVQRALTTLGGFWLSKAQFMVDDQDMHSYTYESKCVLECLGKAKDYCSKAYDAIIEIFDPDCSESEKAEMRSAVSASTSKIFLLLGLQKLSDTAFLKAESLMKTNKFWERLIELYESQAGLEHKRGELEKALEFIDKALKVIGSDRKQYNILLFKGTILLDLRSFEKAKSLLIDVYKKSHKRDKETAKHTLKGTLKILKILEDEEEDKKMEKVGDACANLEAYHAALWYYNKAVMVIQNKCEISTEEKTVLSGLYASLAVTYKDLKLYDKSIEFYLMEFEMSKNRSNEAYSTIMCLALATGLQGKPFDIVKKLYKKARSIARNIGCLKRELHSINEYLKFINDRGMEDDVTLREKFDTLMKENGFCEDDIQHTDEAKDNLSFSDEDVDIDLMANGCDSKKRKRGKIVLRKDPKGETELHRKVKKPGNIKDVLKLIEQSSSVDIEDNAKYTPLHEACNHGQIEYVKALVEGGANVNKFSNNGTTPLISAAIDGHLDVIEFILEKGGQSHYQDEDGWSALDHLEEFNKEKGANLNENETYKKVCDRLRHAIEIKAATGLRLEPKNSISSGHIFVKFSDLTQSKQENMIKKGNRTLNEKDHNKSNRSRDAKKYQNSTSIAANSAYEGIHLSRAQKVYSKDVVTEEEYESVNMDEETDWLEDDLAYIKKRKVQTLKPSRDSKRSRQSNQEDYGTFNRGNLSPEHPEIIHLPVSTEQEMLQISPPKANAEPYSKNKPKSVSRVRVKVEDKLFLIPLFNQDATAEWLSEEASKRFYDSTGRRPVLKLTTMDGAEICSSDPVALVLGNEDDVLIGVFTTWDSSVPLDERYVRRCADLNRPVKKELQTALISADQSGTFLYSQAIPSYFKELEPCFDALRYGIPSTLKELSIPRCRLFNNDLGLALGGLHALRTLNLSNVGLNISESFLPSYPLLEHLDLSFNELNDESLTRYLSGMTSLLSLNVAYCGLSHDFILPEDVCEKLHSLDISGNPLSMSGLRRISRALNPQCLKTLKISHCGSNIVVEDILRALNSGKIESVLASLDISDLGLTEPFRNVSIFDRFDRLNDIDISRNYDIRLKSITDLLESIYSRNVPIKSINATYLPVAFQEEDEEEVSKFLKMFERVLVSNKDLREFSFMIQNEKRQKCLSEALCNKWKSVYRDRSRIKYFNCTYKLEAC